MVKFYVVDSDELQETGQSWFDVSGEEITPVANGDTYIVRQELVLCKDCLFYKTELCPLKEVRGRNFFCGAGRRRLAVDTSTIEREGSVTSVKINPENWDYYA